MPTHYTGTSQEVLALDTFIKFTRAYESLMSRLNQRGTQGNLTPSQFGLLETLYHLGPMCQGEVSSKLLKSTGNITLVLDNLEKCGFVRRVHDSADRRRIMLHLTETGRSLIERIFPEHAASITEELSILEPAEQEALATICRKLGKRERA